MSENNVNKDNLENQINKVLYYKIGNKTTICCMILKNGFELVGYSSCVDYKNYNKEKGENLAFNNAFNQLWSFEAYVMQNRKTYNQKNKVEKLKNVVNRIDNKLKDQNKNK